MVDYEPIGQNRFREQTRLLEANSAFLVDTAEFPGLPSDAFKEKFKCCSKFAISLKNQLVAVITPDRQLELYGLKEDCVVPKCRLQVLFDPHPEFCLLEWSASQNILISTRSTAVLDVFESTGVYSYSISLEDQKFDARRIICQIRTEPSLDSDSYDIAYVLQLHSKFSVYRLGKGNMFEPLCSISLGLPRSYCFAYVPSKNFVIATTEYQTDQISEEKKFTDYGLALYEYRHNQIEKKAAPTVKSGWNDWFPVFGYSKDVVVSLEVNEELGLLLAVSSRGDAFILNMKFEFVKFISGDEVISEAQFVQGLWTENQEMAMLHRNGLVIQEEYSKFFDDYLKGELKGTVIKDCKFLSPGILTEVFALTETESTTQGTLAGGDYFSQFWFVTLFRLNFFYKWIKALSGAAVGQPIEEVRSDYERLFHFALYKVRTVTLMQYVKKLLGKGEYAEAQTLARSDPNFELDLIYKQQWTDLKAHTDESLVNVLRCIKDKRWVINECLHSNSADVEVQRQLLDLADLVVSGLGDPKLMEKVHNSRLIFDCLESTFEERSELFLRFRAMSPIEAALHFAQESSIENLVDFISQHADKLRSYILAILSLIPEAVPVHRYDVLLPWKEAGEGRLFSLDGSFPSGSLPKEFLHVEHCLFPPDSDVSEFVVDWYRKRALQLDSASGLIENVIAFFHTAIEHGFHELQPLFHRFQYYADFVCLSSAVAMSFDRFVALDAVKLRAAVLKHMKESLIMKELERLVEMFEEFHSSTAHEDVLEIVRATSQNNFAILHSLWVIRPNFVSKDMLTACFMESKLVGPPLICAMEKFNFEPASSEVLKIFADYECDVRFSVVHESRTSAELAHHLLYRFLQAALRPEEPNWIDIMNALKEIWEQVLAEVMNKQHVVQLFASQLLLKMADGNFHGFPFHLVVDVTGKDPSKLPPEKWQELLLEKSLAFIDGAEPNSADRNLQLAREVLTLIPRKHEQSKQLETQRQLVEVIEKCIELGLPRLPATYRFSSPDVIMQEVVAVNANYKLAKKIIVLTKLLGYAAPEIRAYGYCALEAFKAGDVVGVRKLLDKLNQTSKGDPFVFKVCKEMLDSAECPELKQELLTCVVLNCPNDEITTLSDVLQEMNLDSSTSTQTRHSASPESMVAGALTKLKDNLLEAPIVTPKLGALSEGDDELHLDPNYTGRQHRHNVALTADMPVWKSDVNPLELAKQWTCSSATTALVLAALSHEDAPTWTSSETLNHAAVGLRRFLERMENVSPHILEQLPTNFLLNLAQPHEAEVELTAVERILRSGCDRARFFEDAEYRLDTLLGLIMTKDREMINDIKESAEQFKVSTWALYMSLVEFALTDDEVSATEARLLIKEYDLREALAQDYPKMCETLRSSVFALLPDKDSNRLKLYLSFFKLPDPEAVFFKVAPNVIRVHSATNLKHFVKGEEKVILAWIRVLAARTDHDDDFLSVLKFLRALSTSKNLLVKIASCLRLSPDLTAARRIRLLFHTLDKDSVQLIQRMSEEMSPLREEAFWNEVLSDWQDLDDASEARLLAQIRSRLQELKVTAPMPSRSYSPTTDFNASSTAYSGGFNDFSEDKSELRRRKR